MREEREIKRWNRKRKDSDKERKTYTHIQEETERKKHTYRNREWGRRELGGDRVGGR